MRSVIRKLALTVGAVAGLVLLHAAYCVFVPAGDETLKLVEVAPGTTVRGIANHLCREGVIRNAFYFRILARLAGHSLQAGEFGFRRERMTKVLETLRVGRVHMHHFLVREGDSLYEIAAALERRGLADEKQFVTACGDVKMLKSLGVTARSAEGYIFPDTYYFPSGLGAGPILEIMVGRFFEKVSRSLMDRAKEAGFNLHSLITFASIVEKEARVPEERPVIAAVFRNRLKRKMLLQADPTVLYALRRWDNRLSRKDLHVNSRYNTYRFSGLPPGPICNPGLSCLIASVEPARVAYLYFVTRKDGTGRHVFSRTLAEHHRAVKRSKKPADE